MQTGLVELSHDSPSKRGGRSRAVRTSNGAFLPDLQSMWAALEMTSDAVFFLAGSPLRIRQANRAAVVRLGYSSDELRSLRFADVARDFADQETGGGFGRLQRGEVPFLCLRTEHRCKNGSVFPAEIVLRHVPANGHSHMIAVSSDVSDRHRLLDLSKRSANRDPLTGLPNRAVFEQQLSFALHRARRTHYRFAVFFIDLDDFKQVNDRYGHVVGDRVLADLAGRLVACARRADMVARYAGDEFVVLADGVRSRQAMMRVARRLQRKLAVRTQNGSANVHVTASIGMALGSSRVGTPAELVARADQSMYRQKAARRLNREKLVRISSAK